MSGPGAELGKLIPDWLAKQSKGCGCNNLSKRMDRWGVAGCKAKREFIVQRVVAQATMLPLPLRCLPKTALKAGAAVLVDRAIENSMLSIESTEKP